MQYVHNLVIISRLYPSSLSSNAFSLCCQINLPVLHFLPFLLLSSILLPSLPILSLYLSKLPIEPSSILPSLPLYCILVLSTPSPVHSKSSPSNTPSQVQVKSIQHCIICIHLFPSSIVVVVSCAIHSVLGN